MAQDYYTILTNAGLAYEAQQKAQNKPITLTTMAIGDGNGAVYNPDPTATTLRREVHRQPINALLQDPNNPNWLVCEGWLADDVGGWTIREVGIFTDTGVLYAICKYPESIKPLLVSGSGKQFYVRSIFQTSNAANVTLLVDNSVVMAPRAYVIDYVRDELAKLDSKQSVRAATTGPIVLTGLGPVDDVALTAGDRVLVKDQVAGAENGIYVAGAGAWARAADANSAAKLTSGAVVPVESGSLNADTLWMLKTDGAVTPGTTALSFQWVGGLNAPDQPPGDSSRKIANTAFVASALAVLSGYPKVYSILSLPTSNVGPIIVAEVAEVWVWSASQYFAGYRSPLCGRPLDGHTVTPLASEIDAVGGTLSKTAYAGLWGYAQENSLVVASGAWSAGMHKFVDLGGDNFRCPDLRNQFRRFTGTDADTANARTLGTPQKDQLRAHDHRLTLSIPALASGSIYADVGAAGDLSGVSTAVSGGSETRPTNAAYAPRIHV